MFRKISYLTMVASVVLSWGMILNLAQKADRANGTDLGPVLSANASQSLHAYLSKSDPAGTALVATSRPALQKEQQVVVTVKPAKEARPKVKPRLSTVK